MAKATSGNAAKAAELLGQLGDLLPTAKPKATGKQKWEVVLVGHEAEVFLRWQEAKNVSEIVDARLENSKDDLGGFCLRKIAEAFWKTKNRPLNPTLIIQKEVNGKKVTDCQATYLFTDKFKYRFPEIPEGVEAKDHIISVLTEIGLEEADAKNLVEKELDLNPVTGIRPLTELLNGKYGEKRQFIESSEEEKSAGRKLLAFLTSQPDGDGNCTVEALTPEERALCIRRDPGIKVKAGFYQRVCSYVHSIEQLLAVFKVIVPIAYPAHQKFGMNDTPEGRATRLVEGAAGLIGVGVVEKDEDEE